MIKRKAITEMIPVNNQADLTKYITSFLTSKRNNYFTTFKRSPEKSISQIFKYLEQGCDAPFDKIIKITGNEFSSGAIESLCIALKDIKMISSDNIEGLNTVCRHIIKGLESYALILAVKNDLLSVQKANDDYTIGNFMTNLQFKFRNRCKYSNIREPITIEDMLDIGRRIRNNEFHFPENAKADKTEFVNALYEGLLFMTGANYLCYQIYNARWGGLRYHSSKPGTIKLYLNGIEQGYRTIKVNDIDNSEQQFLPIYQINLQSEFSKGSECKAIFTPIVGKPVSYTFEIKEKQFVFFKYIQPEEPTEAIDSPQSPIIPEVLTSIDLNKLKTSDFADGKYSGSLDLNGLPNGVGILFKENLSYQGNFEKGKPVNQFTVKSLSGLEFTYVGTLNEDMSPLMGTMTYTSQNKSFKGVFSDWYCTKGQKYRGKKLVYDGEFILVEKNDGTRNVLYHGKGKLYEEDFEYTGEFFMGHISGIGCKTYKDPGIVPQAGRWEDDIFLGPVNQFEKMISAETPNQPEQQIEDKDDGTVTVLINTPDTPFEIRYEDSFVKLEMNNTLNLNLKPGTELIAYPIIHTNERFEKLPSYSFDAPTKPDELVEWDLKTVIIDMLNDSDNKYTGSGELIFDDGSKYIGKYDALGRPDGYGLMVYPNGDRYEGDFKAGKYYGQGILQRNRISYEGGFKDGLYHGFGRINRKYGEYTEGNFDNGKKDGIFLTHLRNGIEQKEKWVQNELIQIL